MLHYFMEIGLECKPCSTPPLALDTFDNVDYKDVGDDEGVHTASTSFHFSCLVFLKLQLGSCLC